MVIFMDGVLVAISKMIPQPSLRIHDTNVLEDLGKMGGSIFLLTSREI